MAGIEVHAGSIVGAGGRCASPDVWDGEGKADFVTPSSREGEGAGWKESFLVGGRDRALQLVKGGGPSELPRCLCLWPLPMVTKWGPEEERVVTPQNSAVGKQLREPKGLPWSRSRGQKVTAAHCSSTQDSCPLFLAPGHLSGPTA